jgi:ABC-type transporter Mla maintaining outer membrane lipid asymmetry ATPase subunit MlaF
METPANMESEKAIEMSGVDVPSLRDLRVTVVEDVNWTVRRGEYWVMAGMQGSGKTDFMSMVAGLTPPRQGSYRLFGTQMPIFEGDAMTERLKAGLVFDNGQLLHQLTVRENVALPLRYHRDLEPAEVEARVWSMLKLTQLEPWAERTPGNLGRHLQKRAGLARALMLEPELLLLDNPLVGLDIRHANWWLDFLQKLCAGELVGNGRKMTVVASAEDLRPWRGCCTHFSILENRRFIALGGGKQLEGNTESLVKELLAEARRAG